MSFHKAMGEIVKTLNAHGGKIYKIDITVTYNSPDMAEVTIYKYDMDDRGKHRVENGEVVTLPKETYYLEKWDDTGFWESEFIEVTSYGDDGKHFLEWRKEISL